MALNIFFKSMKNKINFIGKHTINVTKNFNCLFNKLSVYTTAVHGPMARKSHFENQSGGAGNPYVKNAGMMDAQRGGAGNSPMIDAQSGETLEEINDTLEERNKISKNSLLFGYIAIFSFVFIVSLCARELNNRITKIAQTVMYGNTMRTAVNASELINSNADINKNVIFNFNLTNTPLNLTTINNIMAICKAMPCNTGQKPNLIVSSNPGSGKTYSHQLASTISNAIVLMLEEPNYRKSLFNLSGVTDKDITSHLQHFFKRYNVFFNSPGDVDYKGLNNILDELHHVQKYIRRTKPNSSRKATLDQSQLYSNLNLDDIYPGEKAFLQALSQIDAEACSREQVSLQVYSNKSLAETKHGISGLDRRSVPLEICANANYATTDQSYEKLTDFLNGSSKGAAKHKKIEKDEFMKIATYMGKLKEVMFDNTIYHHKIHGQVTKTITNLNTIPALNIETLKNISSMKNIELTKSLTGTQSNKIKTELSLVESANPNTPEGRINGYIDHIKGGIDADKQEYNLASIRDGVIFQQLFKIYKAIGNNNTEQEYYLNTLRLLFARMTMKEGEIVAYLKSSNTFDQTFKNVFLDATKTKLNRTSFHIIENLWEKIVVPTNAKKEVLETNYDQLYGFGFCEKQEENQVADFNSSISEMLMDMLDTLDSKKDLDDKVGKFFGSKFYTAGLRKILATVFAIVYSISSCKGDANDFDALKKNPQFLSAINNKLRDINKTIGVNVIGNTSIKQEDLDNLLDALTLKFEVKPDYSPTAYHLNKSEKNLNTGQEFNENVNKFIK